MKSAYAVGLLTLATSLASPALAQTAQEGEESSGGLTDIIVTATKRSENLQDVPVAVSAIDAEGLKARGVFETSDLGNRMPNLQVSSPFGQQQPNFSLRGVGVGTEFNANAASPVGVYVDEVYQTFRVSHGQQLYDLEQIEVVRGPQGTLFGRNTTGGAINFITRQPQLEGQEGFATVGYGNLDRIDLAGAVEVTPVPDMFGIRLAGTYSKMDPHVRNVLPKGPSTASAGGASGLNFNSGTDPGGIESYGIRVSARIKPSDNIDLSFKFYAAETNGGVETPIVTGSTKGSDVIDYTNPNFLFNGIFNAFSGLGLLPTSYSREGRGLSKREVEGDTVGDAYTSALGGVITARITLSDSLSLTSITGYDSGAYEQLPTTECDGTPLSLCAIGYASKFNAFNQDLRFDLDAGRFKLIAGLYYGKDTIKTSNQPNFFNFLRDIAAAVGLPPTYFNPGGAFNGTALSATSLPTGVSAFQYFKQDRKSSAIYGEGSFEITDTLKLTAGARYTIDKNKISDAITTFIDDTGTGRFISVSDFTQGGVPAPYFLTDILDEAGNVVIPSFQGLGIPLPNGLEDRGKTKRLSGRVIVDWKPTDETLVYGSYSRGYRAGTFNGLAYGSANQIYFVPPETVDAFEVGFKTRFLDNRLQINGAAFYYKYKGQQGQVVDRTATANLVSLDGKLKGAEVDIQFAPIDQLRFSGSLGIIDSKYDSGDCPATPITGFPAQVGNCLSSSGGNVSVSGNPFPYAAKISANIGADWDVVEFGDGVVTLHGDANYTGRFYYDGFKNYTRGPLPNVITGDFSNGGGKYWVFNSRLSYTTDRYTFAVWGKNLTDKLYYPFGIAIENLFGNGYRVRAQPRTYGVEATYRF